MKILFTTPIVAEIVYGLVDPAEPSCVRYVGRTADPLNRYRQHCKGNSTTLVKHWVANLADGGRVPTMVLLERVEIPEPVKGGTVSPTEMRWIRRLSEQGQADLNLRLMVSR